MHFKMRGKIVDLCTLPDIFIHVHMTIYRKVVELRRYMWLNEVGCIIFFFLSFLMTNHQVCNKSNRIHLTCGGAPTYLSGAPEFFLVFSGVLIARS